MKTYVSINHEITAALSPILPTAHLTYNGRSPEYIIFRVENMRSTQHASGDNQGVICYGFVDIFTVEDPSRRGSLLEEIDYALEEHDFKVASIGPVEYYKYSQKYHTEIAFHCLVKLEGFPCRTN